MYICAAITKLQNNNTKEKNLLVLMLFWGAAAALPGEAEVKIFIMCPLPRGNSKAVIRVNTRRIFQDFPHIFHVVLPTIN